MREYGFNTIADISTASVRSIASVHGISEDSAYYIKRITDDIVSTTRKGAQIRLSEDDKSKLAKETIIALSKFRKSIEYVENARIYIARTRTTLKVR